MEENSFGSEVCSLQSWLTANSTNRKLNTDYWRGMENDTGKYRD